MAGSRSVLRVPSSSLSFNDLLARNFPTKVNKNAVKARLTRANRVKSAASKRALVKELVALGIDIDKDEEPAEESTSHDSERRYELRGCDKGQAVADSTLVTKAPCPRVIKVKTVYEGPGYLGKSPRITKKGKECKICAETQGSRQFPEEGLVKGCNHESNICRTCIARHTEILLATDGKWRRVHCLECKKNLTKTQVCKLVWREHFERLLKFAKTKADEANPRYRSCLSSTCDSGQVHYEGKFKNPVVVCKACGSESCFNHGIPWHEGYTCEMYDDSHPNALVLRTNEERLKTMAKRCPTENCGVYIEKEGGCNTMFCSRCMKIFDWTEVEYETPTEQNQRSEEIYYEPQWL